MESQVGLAKRYEVSFQQVCWHCDTAGLRFDCTDEISPLEGFIGQDRALHAIQFGLEVDKPGYNLFVTGLTGTGKTSAIKRHIQSMIDRRKEKGFQFTVSDWCYGYNFADADRPLMLSLPLGRGKLLRQSLEELLGALREELPKVFGSEEYLRQRTQVEEAGHTSYHKMMQELEREVRAENFGLQLPPTGLNLFPLTSEGKPLSTEEFMALGDVERQALEEKRDRLLHRVREAKEKLESIEKDTREKVRTLDRDVGEARLDGIFHHIMEEHRSLPEVTSYLNSIKEYSLDHLGLFEGEGEHSPPPVMEAGYPVPGRQQGFPFMPNPFLPFELNVLVDNTDTRTAPVIIETNPTWGILFGRIERRALMGTYLSDHMMLKPGSIHLANGGYLVLNARDLLLNPGVWEGLKRTIRDKATSLEDPAVQFRLIAPQGLRPEPIPWEAKIIVTGDEALYRLLSTFDGEDFWELFKVKAEFDYQIDLTADTVDDYCAFICGACQNDGLLHADRGAVARIVEYGARLVADQTKLSSRFGQINDLLIEADYWARNCGAPRISGEHVKKALDEKVHRLNLVEERIRRLICEGSLMVDTEGTVVGQVNGLSVYDLGDFSFGRPSRITAITYAGRQGVIDIEREAGLSGRIHDKGVLVLSGYLGWKFAQNKPLSLTASLSFEQCYEGVEGDSAATTELYAILSSLAELPINQGIAVTGSVNQRGEIQPIGGANQKVEGFFDVCRVKGLTGEQGVIVPHQNVKNLMLRDDVVEAVKEGKFHIYAVKNIDEGIEVLTGRAAGKRQDDGSYPVGTVHYVVNERLKELGGVLKGYYAEMIGAA